VRALGADEKLRRLFLGVGVPEHHSEADMALCVKLASWTQKNPHQIDRLFRQSKLMRPKWDDRRGDQTYGQITIEKAIAACTQVYALEEEPHLAPIAELLNQPDEEHRWVVHDRMPTGGLVLVVAKPKVGKSVLVRALVAAVAQGKPWLGFDTLQGSVAYIDFDGKPGEVKAHFKKL